MKWLLIFLMAFGGGISSVQASPWPYYSFEIIGCIGNQDCTSFVSYGNAKTYWRDIPDTLKSTELMTRLTLLGVHCSKGDKPGEFSACEWGTTGHAPLLVNRANCKTTEDDNWILASPEACEVLPNISGTHSGSGPGAECAVLAKTSVPTSQHNSGAVDTPFGLLTAKQVANSRDLYCIKAQKPSLDCNINIPNGGILDHGTQAPNSTSERTLDVEIDCGDDPVITMTDDTVPMDNNRIQSKLSLTPNGPRYLLKSVLTAINATAGNHTGSSVIVVSPL